MKHLFTLSERLKGRGRGSVTSASAIFCKLVGMVKLFMPFMKATKRQSDTTIFAESAESAESAKPIFANRGVKDVRVSLDQSPTNIQRISNLYLTPNRYLTRFAAVFALVFVLGVGNVWGVEYDKLFSIKSDDVVSSQGYAAYSNTVDKRDWVITYGGNNKSVGTNSSKRSNCTLSSYSKYAVSPVTTSSIASAFASTSSISGVSKISYTINGGSNQTNTEVYLLYSSNNTTFSQITLTSGTQGAAIESGTAYEFAECSGYFALLFVATNSSGNWRIDDVEITFYEEATPAVKHTVTWKANGSDYETTEVNEGSKPTFPDNPTSCDGTSTTFVGWTTTPWSGKLDDVSTKTIYTSGSAMPNVSGPVTYHAVFAKCVYSKISDYTSLSSGNQIVIRDNKNSNIFNNDFTATYDNVSTTTITPLAKQIWTITGNNTEGWTFKSGSATLGFTTAPTSGSKTQSVSNTSTNSSSWKLANLTGTYDGCISIKKGTAVFEYSSGWKVYYNAGDQYAAMQIFKATYSNYATSCCTPLAQVEGSVNVSNLNEGGGQATWSWTGATTGISKNILKVYNASTDALVKTIDNISASATSQSISGLETCTSYYATLTTVASTGYCEGEEQGKSENFTTNGWAVHYTSENDETAWLSNVTKITGATSACTSENYVATFEAQTGYKLPNNITVYIAGGEQTVNEDYTWSISNGVGTLTIFTSELNKEIDVRIIGEELGCAADPSIGAASLSGDFNLSTVGVTVGTSGTGHEDCGWTDYGFVWGTSVNPTVTNDTHTTQVGTSGNATSWNGNLSGSFETGVTYYFRAYGKNSKDDGEYVYGAGGSFTPRSVTFNSNGGSDVATAYVNSGEAIVAPSVPTKTGYDFDGWQLSGAAYDFAALVSGNIVLDAVWTAKTMDVTLDNQSATTAGTDKVTGTYDQGLPSIATNLPEKTGYTFQGYYSETGGKGMKYINADGTANGTWDKEVATTLYAYWTINSYTVTWKVAGNDYNAGVTDANDHANYNTTVNVPTAPAASLLGEQGCADTFMGWSKKNGGHDAKAASYYDDLFTETSPEITDNTTFYAVFAQSDVANGSATFNASDLTATPETANSLEWQHTASGIKLKLSSGNHYTKGQPNTFTIDAGTTYYAEVTAASGQTITGATVTTTIDANNSSKHYCPGDVSSGSRGDAVANGDYEDYAITGTITSPLKIYATNYQMRVVELTVNYSTTSYSDYVTECAPLTCSVPQSLASTPGKNGATLSWSAQEVGTASKYQYAVWAVGADEPTSGYSETTELTAEVSGLMSNTDYNWKVRTVCTGTDGESEFAKSTFTTGSVDLTFSVPTGVSSVTASTSASALPSAGVPDACAGCWSFAGWSSTANATSVEYVAGGSYKFNGDKTLYAVYGRPSNTYKLIDKAADLTANENYVLTYYYNEKEYALSGDVHPTYSSDALGIDVTSEIEEVSGDYYIDSPDAAYVWTFTGSASAGQLYNADKTKYLRLSETPILHTAGENLKFVVDETKGYWTISYGTSYYLHYYTYNTIPDFDRTSNAPTYSAYIYKRQLGTFTTNPDCNGHTVEWYVAGEKVRTDEGVSSCDGVASLPSVDVADIRCKTEGTTFMGWSETNVGVTPTSDADEIAALNLFTDAANAPAITADKQFYAVFAEGSVTGTESKTIKYSVATTSTLTSTGTSPEGTSATYSQTYNTACQMTKGNSATLTLKDWGTTRITKLVLSMKSNSSSGNGKLRYSIDGGTNYSYLVGSANSGVGFDQAAWNGDWSTSYVDITKDELAITGTNANDIIIQIEATANSLFCESYEITYDVPVYSYADYFTECCPQKAVTLSGVDDEVGKHFEADVEAVCAGETVTLTKTENGYYNFAGFTVLDEDEQSVEVTANLLTGEYTFEMPASAVTVTASWTAKNYIATITDPDPAEGSVEVVGGTIVSEQRQVAYGGTLTVTAHPADDDHYFQNWTVTPDIPELDLTQNPLVITMPGNNIDVTANFGTVADPPALTLETNEAYTLTATLANGDPIANMGAIRSGTALKVSYVLNGQNEKTGWTLTPATTYGESENYITFNMPSEDLRVALAVRPYYTLGLSAENGSISSVSINSEAQTPTTTSYNVHAGEIVEVVATPTNDTYKFKEWVKTGDAATYSDASTTATLKVGNENMTLKAVFEAKATYNLTLNALGRTQEVIPALEGTDVASLLEDKNAVTLKGYHFEGWSETEDGEAISGDALKLNGDKTVYAVYSAEAYYQKVTSTDDITDGQYLIVYEDGEVAFNGGLTTLDAENNTIDVTINNGKIDVTNATTAAEFTIDVTAGTIKSASGQYIGQTSDGNGLTTQAEPLTNTMSITSGKDFTVKSSGNAYLRYNSASNQLRFRYYKSSSYTGQKAIQLYKKVAPGANESNPTTVVANNEVLVIDADATLNNLTVKAGGKVDGSGNLTVNDFTIEGQDGKSGQVMNAHKLTINGDAYFDFTLAVSGTKAANQWHNFSVPFPVSVMDGVYNAETGAKLTNEVDYAIEDYHGDLRAQGKYGWKKYRGIMQPGITYSMTVNGDIQTFRFKKVAGAYSFDANPSVGFSQYTSGENTDAGWNGLGNMRLCYASVNNENIKENNGVRYVQILDAAEYAYKSYAVGEINLTVGSAFFIQAANNGTMTFAAAHNAPDIVYAPARTEAKRTDKPIAVTLSNENQSDRMYITASEDAKSEYQIGCDLQKMFATNTPQAPMIYSVNYGGIKLAAEEAPIVNDKASYALSLYAPANGTYRIETPTESDNADLYLTKDGHVIWNLSMNGYEVELTKGTTEGYGLLLVRKAPSVATGVDEPTSDSSLKGRATKVVMDEHVYILRDGQMYDVTGKAVK